MLGGAGAKIRTAKTIARVNELPQFARDTGNYRLDRVTQLFVYGTLRHLPLLEQVLGRPAAQIDCTPACLPGYAIYGVEDADFPMILEADDGLATGLLLRDLSADDMARLNYYEAGFSYETKALQVETDMGWYSALVYFDTNSALLPTTDWSFEHWVTRYGGVTVRMAIEIMAHRAQYTPAEIATRKAPISARADSWFHARERRPDPDRDIATDVVVHKRHLSYMNYFATEELDFQYRRNDGTLSPVLNRCAMMMGRSAVVLPYDPVRDCVLLVEQFRAAVYMNGDPAPWVWEPIAGLVEAGETPEDCARRETIEEAGVTVNELHAIGPAYSSTGSSADFVHMFVGISDLGQFSPTGGVEAEGEDIRAEIIPYQAFIDRVDRQEYVDMPLMVTGLWLARHRDRLRKQAG